MQLTESVTHNGTAVVRVAGDVDLGSCDELAQALAGLLERPAPVIVVDLAGVDFFDSTGLRTLDDYRLAAEARAGRLLVSGAGEQVRRLFRITGLCDAFAFYDTAEDAAAADGGRG